MRLEPVNKWVTGRAAVSPIRSTIIKADPAKGVTRFYLIEEASKEAVDAGYKTGGLVVAKHAFDMFFEGGVTHRVTFSIDEIICRVYDVRLEDLLDVYGKPFVVPNGNGTPSHEPDVLGAPA